MVSPMESASIFKFKQVIILRSDLKMSPGKAAAQASHAAVLAAEKARKNHPQWWREWFKSGQRKVVLKVNSKADLLNLEKKAKDLALPTALVSDMGLTELEPGTITALGIGPAPSSLVDKVTGSLPLY